MKSAGFKITLEHTPKRVVIGVMKATYDAVTANCKYKYRIDGFGTHKRQKSNRQNVDGVEPNCRAPSRTNVNF